jgi:catechol 2,3-dioxygenase-like lactoylglutathione lyase family enzyme
MTSPAGLPAIRTLDHVGLTLPDVLSASRFLVNALGFVEVYTYVPPEGVGEIQERQFGRHPRSRVEHITTVRLGTLNLELFEFSAPDQRRVVPRSSDWGAAHLAFYVDDLDAAVEHLRHHGAEVLGEPMQLSGPESGPGNRFIFALAPGGLTLELITYPTGKAYEQTTSRRLFDPRTQEIWSPTG